MSDLVPIVIEGRNCWRIERADKARMIVDAADYYALLERLMAGARERILLVEVGDSWLVVGVVPGQIKTLHTLPKGELPAVSGDKPFGQWLKQISERGQAS